MVGSNQWGCVVVGSLISDGEITPSTIPAERFILAWDGPLKYHTSEENALFYSTAGIIWLILKYV